MRADRPVTVACGEGGIVWWRDVDTVWCDLLTEPDTRRGWYAPYESAEQLPGGTPEGMEVFDNPNPPVPARVYGAPVVAWLPLAALPGMAVTIVHMAGRAYADVPYRLLMVRRQPEAGMWVLVGEPEPCEDLVEALQMLTGEEHRHRYPIE